MPFSAVFEIILSHMAKDIFIVGVERSKVRALKLSLGAKGWAKSDMAEWPLDVPKAPDDADFTAGEEPSQEPPAESGEEQSESQESPLVLAFKAAVRKYHTKEFTLALPLGDMLVTHLRIPEEDRDLIEEKAFEAIKAISPFPDEQMLPSIETTAETDISVRALAAALPEATALDISDALDESGIKVVRTDITVLGWLRTLWSRLGENVPRRLVLLDLGDGWDFMMMESGAVTSLRSIGQVTPDELKRELTLTLLRDTSGTLDEITVFSPPGVRTEEEKKVLALFAPTVRFEEVEDLFGGIEGAALRGVEGSALDVTPKLLRDALKESRFKAKVKAFLAVAGAIWLILLGVMVSLPMVYEHLTELQRKEIKAHAKAYKVVSDTKERVALVKRYSNRDTSALEMLRIVCEEMPYGIALSRIQYTKDMKLVLAGDAEDAQKVYDFKNNLVKAKYLPSEVAAEGRKGPKEPVFAGVDMKGPTLRKNRQAFTIECRFEEKEDE